MPRPRTPTSPNGMSLDAIPRHLRRPGDEGYRTPTIEDIERNNRRPNLPFRRSFLAHSIRNAVGDGVTDDETISRSQERDHPPQSPPPRLYPEGILHHGRATTGTNTAATTATHSPAEDDLPEKLPWRLRLKHFTWAFFTFNMATGGLANALYSVPYKFPGLTIIGDIFFLGNLVAYIIIWVLIILRFYYHPYALKASFLHPTESLFVPATAVSFGTILINISQYGLHRVGPWLNGVTEVLFWFDATLAVVLSIAIYLLLWSTQYFSVSRMTPIWIFPAYPLLIIGPHAGILSSQLSPARALPIIIGGFTIQGVGFLVSLMVYSAFIYRLMTQKLPRESLRPGMFVSVGPSGFTVAGTINMAANAKKVIPAVMNGEDGKLVATVLKVCADWMCLWLWGLAIWFFVVSVLAHLTAFLPQTADGEYDFSNRKMAGRDPKPKKRRSTSSFRGKLHKPRMSFSMTFFSFVFPNTALVTATFAIAKAFDVAAIRIIGCVLLCLVILTWILVVIGMIRAIQTHVILWPEKGEDRDEGGFKMKNQMPDPRNVENGNLHAGRRRRRRYTNPEPDPGGEDEKSWPTDVPDHAPPIPSPLMPNSRPQSRPGSNPLIPLHLNHNQSSSAVYNKVDTESRNVSPPSTSPSPELSRSRSPSPFLQFRLDPTMHRTGSSSGIRSLQNRKVVGDENV